MHQASRRQNERIEFLIWGSIFLQKFDGCRQPYDARAQQGLLNRMPFSSVESLVKLGRFTLEIWEYSPSYKCSHLGINYCSAETIECHHWHANQNQPGQHQCSHRCQPSQWYCHCDTCQKRSYDVSLLWRYKDWGDPIRRYERYSWIQRWRSTALVYQSQGHQHI